MFNGQGMSFSADHMNDPARIRAMCEEGFMSEGRRDALLDFPWHQDAIFHEAGIPPIHTPMQTLQVGSGTYQGFVPPTPLLFLLDTRARQC